MKHYKLPGVLLLFFSAINLNAQWIQISDGISTNETVSSLAFIGNNIFAGSFHGVYKSSNNGDNWVQTSLIQRSIISMAVNGNTIFATTHDSGVYLSTNNGVNWIHTINIGSFFTAGAGSNNVYVAARSVVERTTNNGASWFETTQIEPFSTDISSMAVNGSNVLVGGIGGVYLSANFGLNWTKTLNTGNGWVVQGLTAKGNNIYAGTYRLYLSTNNGLNWITTSDMNHFTYSIEASGNNIFAGTGEGVYLSTNNGEVWTEKNEGLIVSTVRELLIFNGYIFAGTGGHSVYRRLLSDLVGIQTISTEIPNRYSLSQNYPNPFNPSTKIKFAIPSVGDAYMRPVQIAVYDISGRLVETIVDGSMKQGKYEVEWSAAKYSSGVYFYKLLSGDYVETKKMILVK